MNSYDRGANGSMKKIRNRTVRRDWTGKFLESLATHANISEAARAAGINRVIPYRKRESDSEFAKKWDDAVDAALDRLELVVFERALHDDTRAAMWFLSRRRSHIWGDKLALDHRVLPKVDTSGLSDAEATDFAELLNRVRSTES